MIGLIFSKLSAGRQHRLHHPQRGDRPVPQGRRRRQVRRQARHARPAPDPGERRPPRLAQARQEDRRAWSSTRPTATTPDYPLKEWDLITKIGDHEIDNVGMVKIKDNLRLQFQYLIQKLAKDGKVPLTIVREGKPHDDRAARRATDRPMLIESLQGRYPSYFVYGPLVFSPVTPRVPRGLDRLGGRSTRSSAVIGSPLVTRRGDRPAVRGRGAGRRRLADVPAHDRQGLRQPVLQGGQGDQRRPGQEPPPPGRDCSATPRRSTSPSASTTAPPRRSSSTTRRPSRPPTRSSPTTASASRPPTTCWRSGKKK